MRLIADEDLGRIETALRDIRHLVPQGKVAPALLSGAIEELETVLRHANELNHQAPTLEPRIVPLSDGELQRIYPERYA